MFEQNSLRLKQQTKALIEDIGVKAAIKATGTSEGHLSQRYSTLEANMDRFICIDGVAALETCASYPFVTKALAEINGNSLQAGPVRDVQVVALDGAIVSLCHNFTSLLTELSHFCGKKRTNRKDLRIVKSQVSKLECSLIELKLALYLKA